MSRNFVGNMQSDNGVFWFFMSNFKYKNQSEKIITSLIRQIFKKTSQFLFI